MSNKSKKSNNLSGISVGLAFTAIGLTYAFWLTHAYGGVTNYIAGIFILFGAVGLLVEAQKVLTGSKLRIDNGGVGLLLLVPAGIGAYYANIHTEGFTRGVIIFLLSTVALFGFAGLIDVFVSIAENSHGEKSISTKVVSLLKFLTLFLSSLATIVVAIRQIT